MRIRVFVLGKKPGFSITGLLETQIAADRVRATRRRYDTPGSLVVMPAILHFMVRFRVSGVEFLDGHADVVKKLVRHVAAESLFEGHAHRRDTISVRRQCERRDNPSMLSEGRNQVSTVPAAFIFEPAATAWCVRAVVDQVEPAERFNTFM